VADSLQVEHQHPLRPARSGGLGNAQFPGGRKNADRLVVAGQTVDPRLDENETELGVLVLAVALEVLADGNSLTATVNIILPPSPSPSPSMQARSSHVSHAPS